jgi:hypothetical protein
MCCVAMKTRGRTKTDDFVKVAAYETLCAINQSFERLLANLETLRQLGLFRGRLRREFIKSYRVTVEEARAWVNFEITEALNGYEEREWARFGRLRRQLEKKLEDPDDVLIEAGRMERDTRRRPGKKARSNDRKQP